MKAITQIANILASFIFLIILLCTSPNNPFQDTSSVDLIIGVPEKSDGYNYCVNEKVRFEVTVLLPHLVKKISIHFDENGDKDEKEITTNESKNKDLIFEYEYKEKGLKNVKLTITFRESGKTRDKEYDIDIGVKPTIRNEKNLLVGGDIIPGKHLTLSVDHEKFSKAKYEWYKNSKLISVEDQKSLIFNPLKESDEGQYYCIVSTDWGKDRSKTFNLSFEKTIEIQKHPQSIQTTAGNSARFTIRATGEQIEYQWQKNEEDILGANDTLYEINDLKTGDNATYRCIISNNEGKVISKNAYLKVFEKEIVPKITKHPENREVDEGDITQFSINVDGTNLKYQWFKDNKKIENAVQTIFETGPVSNEDNGKIFHCIVSNSEGEEVSNKATLTVKSVSKPEISEHPQDISVTVGESAMFRINAEGINLKYQWLENGNEIDQATDRQYTINAVTIQDNGKKFSCIISNKAGEVVSEEAVLKVNKKVTVPKVSKQPKNLTVKEKEEARFSITAAGPDIEYQWSKNGKKISGANKSTLKITSVNRDDNDSKYTCVVKNSAGEAESDAAVLTVHYGPAISKQPENIGVKVGEKARFSVEVTKGNPEKTRFQWYKGNSKLPGETDKELEITTEKNNNGDKYSCKVSNDAGFEVESKSAELSVFYIEITKQPKAKSVIVDNSVTFEIKARGNPSIKYQWKKNGSSDVGSNSNKYKFNSSSDDDGATFLCVVSNGELKEKSQEVKLTVLYKVTYDKKGGKGSAEPKTYASGVKFNLPDDLSKDNHTFEGWSIKDDGIADYNSGQEYKMGSKSITFYAVWKEKEKTITIDGVTYREVKIGNQIWMDKDFRKTSGITLIQDGDEWCNTNEPAYCINTESKSKAVLYNWKAVTSDNFAPEGWAVPDNNDWSILADALKGSSEYRSKFNMQPTGGRDSEAEGYFYSSNKSAQWWTTSWDISKNPDTEGEIHGVLYTFNFNNNEFIRYIVPKNNGYSVRLIKK